MPMASDSLTLEAGPEVEVKPAAEGGHAPEMQSVFIRFLYSLGILLPPLGLIAAIILLWGPGVTWTHLGLMIGGYIVTGLGITVGYHRLFTHKAFRTGRVMTAILGILGSMAAEGPLIKWCNVHRRHHQFSDEELDPHSPNHGRTSGLFGMIRGWWHAHIGWIFMADAPNTERYTMDLRKDPLVRFIDRYWLVWLALGILIPGGIAWAITGTVTGMLLGMIWGGAVRIFIVHHLTWSVNSACHLWGFRSYESHDDSRNNPVFGILALGEGWHNNHHAFPTSARHGLAWWQFDLSWLVIRVLQALGLVHDVRLPAPERMAAKRKT